jgi:hypothetical protein
MDNLINDMMPFTPTKLLPPPTPNTNYNHYAMPMVQPVMSKTISSYKKLMNDPIMAYRWQPAFNKDFGSMCQGDSKTGNIGTNTMFVMTPMEVTNMPQDQFSTNTNIDVYYRPQKEDPYRI